MSGLYLWFCIRSTAFATMTQAKRTSSHFYIALIDEGELLKVEVLVHCEEAAEDDGQSLISRALFNASFALVLKGIGPDQSC